jgi:hypothetical protein
LKGSWKKKLNSIIGLGILMAGTIAEDEARSFLSEKIAGKEPKGESLTKQALLSLPTQIPFFGSLIAFGEADPPIIRAVEQGFQGAKQLISGKKPETKIKGGIKVGETIAGLGLGIPGTSQLADILEGMFKEDSKEKAQDLGLPELPKLPKLYKINDTQITPQSTQGEPSYRFPYSPQINQGATRVKPLEVKHSEKQEQVIDNSDFQVVNPKNVKDKKLRKKMLGPQLI